MCSNTLCDYGWQLWLLRRKLGSPEVYNFIDFSNAMFLLRFPTKVSYQHGKKKKVKLI